VLVVAERHDEVSWKSLRNADTVHVLSPGQLNTYDVLISDDVVFTESALQAFLTGSPKGRRAKARARSGELSSDVTPGATTPGEDLAPHEIDSIGSSAVPSIAHADAPPEETA